MAELKYRKNYIFEDKKNLKLPAYRNEVGSKYIKRITLVDKDTVKGAKFYNETMWILPGFGTEPVPLVRRVISGRSIHTILVS